MAMAWPIFNWKEIKNDQGQKNQDLPPSSPSSPGSDRIDGQGSHPGFSSSHPGSWGMGLECEEWGLTVIDWYDWTGSTEGLDKWKGRGEEEMRDPTQVCAMDWPPLTSNDPNHQQRQGLPKESPPPTPPACVLKGNRGTEDDILRW